MKDFSDAPSWVPPAGPSLDALIARVEAATGRDYALDFDLLVALGVDTAHYVAKWPLTASLDAALALVERVLPGWGFYLRRDKDGCACGLTYPEYSRVTPSHEEASTPALTVLLALLRALQAQAQPAQCPVTARHTKPTVSPTLEKGKE